MTKREELQRRRRAGTASVEVIVMLPFFLIVYSGIYFMYGHYMGRQQALLRARSCAWTYAAGGCDDKETLETCLRNPPRTPNADGTERDEDAPAKQPSDDANAEIKAGAVGGDDPNNPVAKVINTLEGIPVLGDAIKWLLGKPVTVQGRQFVHLSKSSLKASDIIVGAKYHTLCNSVPKRWEQVAKDIFCNFVGKFPGC